MRPHAGRIVYRRFWLTVVALGVLGVAAQPAAAAKPFALFYSSETASLSNNEVPQEIEVFCRPGTRPLGGGAFTLGGDPAEDVEVTGTAPLDLIPDDDSQFLNGWVGAAVNSSDTVAAMGVDSICARSVKPKYPSAEMPLVDETVAGRDVMCPAKTSVVGGGITTTGSDKDLEVVSSFPLDGPDKKSQPDDGWFGRASNDSGADETATVFAVCAKLSNLKYRRTTETLGPESTSVQNVAQVSCPAKSKVTGGGVDLNAGGLPSLDLEVAGTFTDDGPDKRAKSDDAWAATAHNDAAEPGQMTVFAICKGPSPKKKKK